jgi:hypothetical protein
MRLLVIMLFLTNFSCFSQSGAPFYIDIPQIQGSGKTVNDFIPARWHILESSGGDLNGDARPDYVLILGVTNKELATHNIDTVRNEVPRLLVVLVSDTKGFKVDQQTHKLILPSAFGGNSDPIKMTEPLSIDTKNKSITVSMYGGSRERWVIHYVFQKEDLDWTLHSATLTTYDSTAPDQAFNYDSTFDLVHKKVIDNITKETHELTWTRV